MLVYRSVIPHKKKTLNNQICPFLFFSLLDLDFACVVVGLDAHVVGSSFSWRPAS